MRFDEVKELNWVMTFTLGSLRWLRISYQIKKEHLELGFSIIPFLWFYAKTEPV